MNVFINCPFDEDYAPILQAVLFCCLYLGFRPRLALERSDAGEVRLEKIISLIEDSNLSIHDLSRCISTDKNELFRLNMPFELGIDYGHRRFGDGSTKSFLILEEKRYRYQAALSDMAGFDIEFHHADFQQAVKKVRGWLVQFLEGANHDGPQRILDRYADFQEWHYEKQKSLGFSDTDIKDYPTPELLDSMREWFG